MNGFQGPSRGWFFFLIFFFYKEVDFFEKEKKMSKIVFLFSENFRYDKKKHRFIIRNSGDLIIGICPKS